MSVGDMVDVWTASSLPRFFNSIKMTLGKWVGTGDMGSWRAGLFHLARFERNRGDLGIYQFLSEFTCLPLRPQAGWAACPDND